MTNRTAAEIMAEDFRNNPSVAKAFNDYAKQLNNIYKCVICVENYINADEGIDTCDECLNRV